MEMQATLMFVERCILLLAIFTASKLNGVVATVYTVGDEEEWSIQTNFASWAAKYNFTVGDVLVFNYVKGQHNAYEVTEETYRSCDASSGVLAKYEDGEDEVVLRQPKKYWFICTISGHCLGGMRFGIEVKQSNFNLAPLTPPQIQPPPSFNSCSNVHVTQTWIFIVSFFVSFGLMLFRLC